MNLRQRYWMAGSLMVVVALGVQRARADEAVPMQAAQWLKLGNQLQRAGRDDEALQAYLEATRSGPAASPTASRLPSEPPLNDDNAQARAKAWLNVALLYVAHASRAIDEVDALRAGLPGVTRAHPLTGQRHDAARQVGAQRHRAYRAAEDAFGMQVPTQPTQPAQSPPQDPAQTAQPFEPYTVDRWIALPRRASSKPSAMSKPISGRSAVIEPLTESPLPAAPQVERLQGLPPGGGR